MGVTMSSVDELRRQMKDLRFARAYGATGKTLDDMIQTFMVNSAWKTGNEYVTDKLIETTRCRCGTWAVGEHCPPLALGGDR